MKQEKSSKSEIEIWKDVVGFEKRYKVSSLGRVLSLEKICALLVQTRNSYSVGMKHKIKEFLLDALCVLILIFIFMLVRKEKI